MSFLTERALRDHMLAPRGDILAIRQVHHPRFSLDLLRLAQFFGTTGVYTATEFRFTGHHQAIVLAEATTVRRLSAPGVSYVSTVVIFSGDTSAISPLRHTPIRTSLREWGQQLAADWNQWLTSRDDNLVPTDDIEVGALRTSRHEPAMLTWTRDVEHRAWVAYVEMWIIQAWRTEVEGNLLGFLFGSVHPDHRQQIMQELTIPLAQPVGDLPLNIISQCDESPVPHVFSRALTPYLQWSACLEELAGNNNPPSQQPYLDPRGIIDLAFFQPRTASEDEAITLEEEEEEDEEGGDEEEEEETSTADHAGAHDSPRAAGWRSPSRYHFPWSACLEELAGNNNPPSQQPCLDPRGIIDLAFFQPQTASEDEAITLEEEEEEEEDEEGGDEEEEEETLEEGSYSEHNEGEQSDGEEEEDEVEEEESEWETQGEEAEGAEEDPEAARKREEIAAGKQQLEYASEANLPISNDPAKDPEPPKPKDGDLAAETSRAPARRRRSRSPSPSTSARSQGGSGSLPGVTISGPVPRSGMAYRPPSRTGRVPHAVRTRAKGPVSPEEPAKDVPEPSGEKEVVDVPEGEDDEDDRLRKEEDEKAEQRAKKRGAKPDTDKPSEVKKKKYAVRVEEGFDVEEIMDRILEVVKGKTCMTMVDSGAEMKLIKEEHDLRLGMEIDRSDNGVRMGANSRSVFIGTASSVILEIGKVKVTIQPVALTLTKKTVVEKDFDGNKLQALLGFSESEKKLKNCGMFLYWHGRLIEAYRRVGAQLTIKADKVLGVIGVADVTPLMDSNGKVGVMNSKQGFEAGKAQTDLLEWLGDEVNCYMNDVIDKVETVEDFRGDATERWIQCDSCGKWRLLPDGMLATSFPEQWYCFDEPLRISCEEPEERWEDDPTLKTVKCSWGKEKSEKMENAEEEEKVDTGTPCEKIGVHTLAVEAVNGDPKFQRFFNAIYKKTRSSF
ncbi:hypothetical protein CBR_g4051 [Chara braunii]|uniref:CW-type domain-containing protein n=1 Tax=Chara braunii TaxID=69332 RepID=A0A388KH83_CHABU|nr:hypothetical protein CBR_g4051 [Chara braunii]|eukprot:GBG69357.1 hypothetical protein CBR_g4051 [Chara braunii]